MPTCIRCHKSIDMEKVRFCPFCGAVQERKKGTRQRGNGTGTAVKRGRTYEARIVVGWRVDDDGKPHPVMRSKRGFKTKQEALEYLPMLRAEKPQKANLDHYWRIWCEHDIGTLSQSKQTAYRIAYGKLGRIVYTDIDSISVDDLKKAVADTCPTYYTARDARTVLKKLYALADADGIGNPRLPLYINLPKLEQKQGEAFTDEQVSMIWSAYDSGDIFSGYILLMIYTGMMPGELLKLKVQNIDLDNRQIIGAGIKTKVRRKATISIAEYIVPVILSLIAQSKNGKIVACSRDTFYEEYHAHITAAGVRDLPPYSCRHTTATALAVGEGVAPQIIRKVMRWSTTAMLSRYAHPNTQDAQDALNRIKRG